MVGGSRPTKVPARLTTGIPGPGGSTAVLRKEDALYLPTPGGRQLSATTRSKRIGRHLARTRQTHPRATPGQFAVTRALERFANIAAGGTFRTVDTYVPSAQGAGLQRVHVLAGVAALARICPS